MANKRLKSVVLAISAFRSDKQILQILEDVFVGGKHPFAAVIVVDSLSDGTLQREISRRGWDVRYESAPVNLGSAGNLARRLEIGAEFEADWCYAINHDGYADTDVIAAMLVSGTARPRVGAVYPILYASNRAKKWEGPRTSVFSRSPPALEVRPELVDRLCAWGSSNGALYSLRMVRSGLKVCQDLWMGWEDLHFGMRIKKAGWLQVQSGNAVFQYPCKYQAVSLVGRKMYVSDKPAWYAYYNMRNLIAIEKMERNGSRGKLSVCMAFISELVKTTTIRRSKFLRLHLLLRGMIDGLCGKMGKGPVP